MYVLTRREMEVRWEANAMSVFWNLPWGIEGQAHFIGVTINVGPTRQNA